MSYQPQIESGTYYHIFNCGNNKENIFIEEDNYYYFLEKLSFYLNPISDVLCYCLLKNHFHLVIKIKSFEELPIDYKEDKKKLHQPLSNFFNSYSKSINKSFNRTGSLFQKPVKRIPITATDYLQDIIIYIHLNPVKHGFQHDFSTYKFSSYSSILSKKPTKLARQKVIELFENQENFKYCHKERLYKNRANLLELEQSELL